MSWKPDVCLYHHPCQDGFAAAWAVWKRWPDCEFIGVNYGQPPPMEECATKSVLIVDFSYPEDSLKALGSVAETIVVLDHHRTAEQELARYKMEEKLTAEFLTGLVWQANADKLEPIVANFDMDRSGARMAWDFCHPDEEAPDLIRFIEDRDLWRFRYPETRPLHFLLSCEPMQFEQWSNLMEAWGHWSETGRGTMMVQARAIERYHDQRVADAAKYAGRIDLAGFNVPIANAPPFMASDLGNKLAEGEPFAVIWWEHWRGGESRVTYELRSKPDGEDVSEIAKQFGGGGHARAAGFKRSETL